MIQPYPPDAVRGYDEAAPLGLRKKNSPKKIVFRTRRPECKKIG